MWWSNYQAAWRYRCALILTGTKSTKELFSGIKQLLLQETTHWTLRSEQPDKVDYVEDDDSKEFFTKRRVEVRLNAPHERNINYPKMQLVNSQGDTIEVCVIDTTEMIAIKMHKLFEAKDEIDTTIDRHSSQTDYLDLNRLIKSKEFDKDSVISYLSNWVGDPAKSLEIYSVALTLLKSTPLDLPARNIRIAWQCLSKVFFIQSRFADYRHQSTLFNFLQMKRHIGPHTSNWILKYHMTSSCSLQSKTLFFQFSYQLLGGYWLNFRHD